MTITTTAQSAYSARKIAEQLLASFDESFGESFNDASSQISLPVIEALRQMVDETKHQDPQRAMQIARVSSTAANYLTDRQAVAIAAWAMATAHVFLFELADALTHYQTAEEIFRSTGQMRQLVSVQSPQIYVLNALGEPTAALALADAVRPHCHALGKDGLAALVNLEMNVGTVLIQQGQFEASLAACERASIAAAQLEDNAALGRIAINRANVFQELDRYADAETAYRDARHTLVASHQNRQQVALVDLNLGLLALRRGDYWQALQHLEAAAPGFTSPAHIAWVDFNRALVYHRLNLNSETADLAARAVDALTTAGSKRELAMALQVWASAVEKQGAFDSAQQLLLRVGGYFRDCGAAVMAAQVSLAMAELALRSGNEELALSLLQDLRQSTESGQLPSLSAQADLIEIEIALNISPISSEPLLPMIERAIRTLSGGGQSALLLRGYRLLGKFLAVVGEVQPAQAAYQKALDLVLEMRHSLLLDEFQIAFLEQYLPIFLETAALYLQSGKDLPQVAHLLALATTTPEQHRVHKVQAQEDALLRLRSDWHWQQSKVEKLLGDTHQQSSSHSELEEAQQQLRRIEVQIADGWRRQGARRQGAPTSDDPTHASEQPAPLSQLICHWDGAHYVARLQDSLAEDEAYLHYFVLDGNVHVLLVRRDTLICQSLGTTSVIDSGLRAWRHQLRDWSMIVSQPAMAQQIAARPLSVLFRALFQPLLPQLSGTTHLNLMLPPQWSDLPLAALLDVGKPLIARWTLSQLVSPLSLLVEHAQRDRRSKTERDAANQSLLIGLAQQTGLNQITAELAQISALAHTTWTHQLLLEDEATLENVLSAMADCDLLHIASHATFRADNPLFSWLQLADGRLTVADLYHRVRLHRQPLTVLSACETARGQHSGLLGVARALLAVGAGELIATQWKVEDHASAQLMGEFYQHWFATADSPGNRTASALASAQRAASQTFHPAYWAGFVNIR